MRFRHACFLLPALALGALLLAAGPGSAPGRSRTLGIDVSRFDGTIRWSPVAGSGVEFAFVEASRGDGDDCTVKPRRCGADPQYERNYEGARSEGIPVGAYHRAFTGGS